MHIKTLQLKNFRRFEDATFEFGSGFNLLVGENGSGKSSVLEGIFASLTDFGVVGQDDAQLKRLPIWTDIRQDSVTIGDRETSSTSKKCEIISNYIANDGVIIEDKRILSDIGQIYPDQTAMSKYWAIFGTKFYTSDNFVAPIVVRIPVPRSENIALIDEFSTYQTMLNERRIGAYFEWRSGGRGKFTLDNWVIFQTLIRYQGESSPFHLRNLNPLEMLNLAFERMHYGIKSIFFSGIARCLMVCFEGVGSTPFDTLSDGQRGLISMVADIARRACLLNPHLGENVLRDTPGIVLIDELDLHLHPKWQRSIVTNLKKTFPKIQFIATTHSPQIIGECKTDEIIIVTETGGKRPSQSFGMDSNWILECLMETPARDQVVQAKIDEMFKAIDENEFGNARALAAALREKIGPAPEVVKADILIHRYGGPRLAAGEAAE